MTFEVWAPRRELRATVRQATRHAPPSGWMVALRRHRLPAGTDYGLVVDGIVPLPDPSSPFQLYGVHGRSRTVDHGGFAWTDARWQLPPLGAGVYEMHMGTFSPKGIAAGVVRHVDGYEVAVEVCSSRRAARHGGSRHRRSGAVPPRAIPPNVVLTA